MKNRIFACLVISFIAFFFTGCTQLTTSFPTTGTTTAATTAVTDDPRIMDIYLLAVSSGGTELTYEEWLASIQGTPGTSGREIELRLADASIEWRYAGEEVWNELIPISDLVGPQGTEGPSGREITLIVDAGYIKWRYQGSEVWNELIALSTLTGPAGEAGKAVQFQVEGGFIQWKYDSDPAWNDLVELSSLSGSDGREIVLDVSGNHIVYKYVGDDSWTELVDLASLTGDAGRGIASCEIDDSGELIITYTDESTQNLGKILEFYTVNFRDIHGYLIDSQTVLSGHGAQAPDIPLVDGFDFVSWDKDFSAVTANISVQAEYQIRRYTVNFYDFENTLIKAETVDYASSATAPEVGSRDHFVFSGWDQDFSHVTGDLSIHQVWVERIYSPEEIYQLARPATVEIRIYGQWGDDLKLGSGFFISGDGLIVTNHHVIEKGYSATVVTADETEYEVTSVIGYDENLDLAILKIDALTPDFLDISIRTVNTGAPVYTLGSPLGLSGSFSDGLVSTASRVYDNVDYIQITAPLSPGNSGGPLLNIYGEVIGVNTATFVDGQNLNLAVNISQLTQLDQQTPTTVEALYQDYWGYDYYPWETVITETEPNNILTEADSLDINGVTVSAELADSADQDWYAFSLDQEKLVTLMVFLTDEADFSNLILTLKDDSGSVIATGTLGVFDAYAVLHIQETLSPTGSETYYIQISMSEESDVASIGYELFFHLG